MASHHEILEYFTGKEIVFQLCIGVGMLEGKETTLPKFCFLKVSAICQAMRYVSKEERFRVM